MAYMHRYAFEIAPFSKTGNTQDPSFSSFTNSGCEYFPIDDLIALPVQVLNRKGYYTAACCSGHPSFAGAQAAGGQWVPIHIIFRKGVLPPSVPPGFIAGFINKSGGISPVSLTTEVLNSRDKQLVIKYKTGDHRDGSVYKNARENINALELLHDWAAGLPDVKQ